MGKKNKRHDVDKSALSKEGQISDYLRDIILSSLEFEKERGDSLKRYVDNLMVTITILSVAYLAPLDYISNIQGLEEVYGISTRQILFVYLILLGLLGCALVIAVSAIFLRSNIALASPSEQFDRYSTTYKEACDEGGQIRERDLLKSYCSSLNITYRAYLLKHNNMWKRLKISTGLTVLSLIMAFVFLSHLLLTLL